MRAHLSVARAVARRSLTHAFKNPALLLPSIVFPLVFLLAFAGGLSAVANAPGFDFPAGYTAFQFVFVLIQSAAFAGVFTGFGIAVDFESGFARRMMLAAPKRQGLLLGYAFAGTLRFTVTATLVTVAALLAGMQVNGGAVDVFGLYGLAYIVNLGSTLFGAGVAFRAKSMQAAPAMQVPIFVTLFLAPVYVPLSLLQGWIHSVAALNPATALLNAGRGFVSGAPEDTALAFLAAVGMVAIFSLWALTGLRRAEREL